MRLHMRVLLVHEQVAKWKQQYLLGEYDRPDLLADLSEMFRCSEVSVALVEKWDREKKKVEKK